MKRENYGESGVQALDLLEPPFIPATRPVRPENPLPGPFTVSGFRYHDGPRCLPRLRVGEALSLHPEPDNPYDAFAVEILFGRAKLGYVPRFCNQRLSQLLAEGADLRCEVARLDADAPPWEAVAVRVQFPMSLDVATAAVSAVSVLGMTARREKRCPKSLRQLPSPQSQPDSAPQG